jgi:hypothetical protein
MTNLRKYLPAVLFFGSLAFNYNEHKHDRPTICDGFLRPTLHTETKPGKVAATVIAGSVFGWLVPHLCREKNQHHVRA